MATSLCRRSFLAWATASALVGCDRSKSKPSGGKYFPLAAAGLSYRAPAGWIVIDPPLAWEDIRGKESSVREMGLSLIYVQANVAAAVFYPNGTSTVVIACQGPSKPYDGVNPDPLSHSADTAWHDAWFKDALVLVQDRVESTVTLGDGSSLAYRQARMLPGVLAGDDVVHAIAFGEVKGRYLAIACSARTERLARPMEELRAHVDEIAATLVLEGDEAPGAISDPG
jgi:hypothetical protein